MKMAHFFIDHPRFATVINIFIFVFGLATMFLLPIAQYPNIVPPTIQITTSYPGASAQTIARTVATPLELAINGVEGMDYISSQSTGNGQLNISVIFKVGTNPNTDLLLTQNRVQDTLSRLPAEVQAQGVQVKKTVPALLLGVHVFSPDGSRDPQYISNYMLHIRDEIARLPGVADYQLFGERDYAMRIWIDPDKAAAYNISASEILAAIRAQNAQVSAGTLNAPPVTTNSAYQINVEALGRLTTPEQFDNIIVKSDDQGRITRIRDIGHSELGSQDYGSIAYADKYPSAPWFPIATPGSNVVQTEHDIWAKMAELRKSFPPGLDYMMIYDPTTFVGQSIHEVIKTIFVAIALVVGVVFIFLQTWRATIIPVVAIPISLVGTFTILSLLGISINNLSMFGLILAVGIVVDDAIVVVENVERNMALGMGPKEAAHKTMDEVSGALIAIALTLCAVFIPTVFISGISGLFFTQFAATIAASTVISVIVSLTLSPALCAVLLKPHSHEKPRGLARLMGGAFGIFNHCFEWLSSTYGRVTARFIRASAIIGLIYLALIGLAGFQMSRMATGFIPEQDIGYQAVIIFLPPGSSLERTDAVVREVNDIILKTVPGPTHTSPVAGLDVTTTTIAPNVATVFYGLPSLYGHHIPGVTATTMLPKVRAALAGVKDAVIIVVNPPPVQGLGSAGGFKFMVEDRGNHTPQELADATNKLVAAANKDKTFAGVFTLYNAGAPSLFADIDREKAEKVGLTPTDVFSTLQLYLGSQYVNDFNYLGRTYQVLVQADQQFRQTTEDIGRLKVRNAQGEMVPMGTVMNFTQTTAPYRQPRYNLYPAADVLGGAAPGIASGTAMKRMEELAKETLPTGFAIEWTELSHQQEQQGIPTSVIFAASAFFVFLVLAAHYESWRLPVAIVLIVPMCLLAASFGLNWRGMPIDILAQIAFVVLLGLAAKNAILIVEFAQHRQDHEGEDAATAATSAAQIRLRPILMTSLAFILGVFPLAVASGAGSEMRQSLGTAVFAGMLGVTIFGLLFTPTLYTLVRKLHGNPKKPASTKATTGLSGVTRRQITPTALSILVCLISIVLTGCAVGPDYQAPQTNLAPFHNGVSADNGERAPLDHWWTSFNDPELVSVIQRALSQNLDLASSLARVQQARAEVSGSKADLLPTFDLNASEAYEHNSLYSAYGTVSKGSPEFQRDTTETQIGPSASWEIDLFGGLRRRSAAATDEELAAEADNVGTRVIVAADTADAYFQVRGFQARLAVAQRQVDTDQQLVDLVTRRYDAGASTEREVAQAEALLKDARASLPPLRLALEQQLNRLDVLMGAQPGTYAKELTAVREVPSIPSITGESPVDVLRRRPDIIAAERRLAASNENIGVAIADYYPKVSLSGLLGLDSLKNGHLFTGNALGAIGEGAIRWRLFDFGKVDAEVAQAKGANAETLAEYRKAVLKAAEDVEDSLAGLTQNQSHAVELQDEIASLTKARDLAQDAYKGGSITLTDVLDADRQLLVAQDQLDESRADAARAAVGVFRAFGGGWDPRSSGEVNVTSTQK